MNAAFWFAAGVLTGMTVAAVCLPWLQDAARRALSGSRRPLAMVAAGLVVFGSSAALLYLAIGSPASLHAGATSTGATDTVAQNGSTGKALSMEDATARLQARLERAGGSAADWELLAKSYEFLGRPADAARAREHMAPTAVATSDAGMPNPSEIAMGAQMLSSPPEASPQQSPRSEIAGTVSIEDRLVSRIGRGATLFIYAKAADSPGPPLAVLRLSAGDWPVSFRLDDSMAMLPSRRLSQFEKVIVEARISHSGQATPAAGDLYVTSTAVSPSSGKKLALVINHEIG